MADYRAAWVPERQDMDWNDAVAIAIRWVEAECAERGEQALLVTVAKNSIDGSLRSFAERHEWTTPRSQNRGAVGRGRPVLAYVPDERTLEVAARFARGSSLCAVEGFGTPLAGWARAAGTADLLGGPPVGPNDPRLQKALDTLHFYGNNGWTTGFGRDHAQGQLQRLQQAGLLNREAVLGDMLARGHSAKAVKRLADRVDRVSGRRSS